MDPFAPSFAYASPGPFLSSSGDPADRIPPLDASGEWAALEDHAASWERCFTPSTPSSPAPDDGAAGGDGGAKGDGAPDQPPTGGDGDNRGGGGDVHLDLLPTWEELEALDAERAAAAAALAGASVGVAEREVDADLPPALQGTGVVLPPMPPLMSLARGVDRPPQFAALEAALGLMAAPQPGGARSTARRPAAAAGADVEGPLAAAAAAFVARCAGAEEEGAMDGVLSSSAVVTEAAVPVPPEVAAAAAAAVSLTPSSASDVSSAGVASAEGGSPAWPSKDAGTVAVPASQCSSSLSSEGHVHISAVTSEATDSAPPSDGESFSSHLPATLAKKRKLRSPSPTLPTDDCRACGVPVTARQTIASLTAELAAARSSSATLDKRLACAHEENRTLRRRVTALTADHHAATARVAQLTSALSAAQQQLSSAAAAAASYSPPAGWSPPGAGARSVAAAGSKRKQASMFSFTFVAVLVVLAAVHRLAPAGRVPADTRLVLSPTSAGRPGVGGTAAKVEASPPGPLAVPYASSSQLRADASRPAGEWRALAPSDAEAAATGRRVGDVPTTTPAAPAVNVAEAPTVAAHVAAPQADEPARADAPAPTHRAVALHTPTAPAASADPASSVHAPSARAVPGSAVATPPPAYSYVLCRDALAAIRAVRRCVAALARGDVCGSCSSVDGDVRTSGPQRVVLPPRPVVVGADAPRPHVPLVGGGGVGGGGGGSVGRWSPGAPTEAPRRPAVAGRGSGSSAWWQGAPDASARPGDTPPSLGELLRVGVADADDGTLSLLMPAAGLGLDAPIDGGGEPAGALAEVICRVTDVRRFVPPAPPAVRAPTAYGAASGGW